MKLHILLLLLIFPLFVEAQSYFSTTPVDEGSFDIPSYLAGNWKEQKNQNVGRIYTILINPNVKGQLQIVPNYGAMTPALLSNVNGRVYVSIYDAGGKEQPEGYYIFRLAAYNETTLKLVPLKVGLALPQYTTLKEHLSKADTTATEAGYALWFSNVYTTKKQPADISGRPININKKTSR